MLLQDQIQGEGHGLWEHGPTRKMPVVEDKL